MDQNITDREYIALARFNIADIKEYSQLLDSFLYGKVIGKQLLENLTKYCQLINDTIPYLRMYFSESLPYLRKARDALVILIQRQKEIEDYPQLTELFKSNLDNINQFFTTFNLRVEELSDLPSDDTQRTLQQRILNPNYDKSPQTRNLVKKIVKTSTTPTLETADEMAVIAHRLRDNYENNNFSPNMETVESSELFIEAIANLAKRDRQFQLSRDRAEELSQLADLDMTPRQRKIKHLLAQSTQNILSENRGDN